MKKYKLGNCSFGTKEDKSIWILKGVIHSLEYIGKETMLSNTENGLRKLAITDINKIIKVFEKQKQK